MPYDWATFLHDRVDRINPRADMDGIERGGYKLVYQEKPSASEKSFAEVFVKWLGGVDAWYSIGMQVNSDGSILDVRYKGPAEKARITPGSKIIGVNGQVYSNDLLQAAIRNAKGKTDPIHLIVQTDTFLNTADIDYHDGERYPVLERVEGTPALLDDITKSLASSPPIPADTGSKK